MSATFFLQYNSFIIMKSVQLLKQKKINLEISLYFFMSVTFTQAE